MTGDPQTRSERARTVRRLAPPREANDQLVTGTITIGWVIALIVLLVLVSVGGLLPASQRWWVWTCVVGVAMGLFGLWYVPVLQRSRARAAARGAQEAEGLPATGSLPQSPATQSPSAQSPSAQSPASGNDSRDSGSKTVSSTDTPGR